MVDKVTHEPSLLDGGQRPDGVVDIGRRLDSVADREARAQVRMTGMDLRTAGVSCNWGGK